ncbi:hypothetical protein [Geobacter sp. DSM 9736]|uniref:hypothetical protein n=1 Tax=Geobacter sp. DSM 9736 TaxID=1277350 RepID=UPI000B50E371|nr:hypothetical protein [Geobacter sp. DSM 9736]SNB47700.1 hypothetical protein SAMN06269301_3192 [Geobacter sp. DSM 9736]
MSIFSNLLNKKDALFELVKDPLIRDLVTKREFRLTEEYLRQELLGRLKHEDVTDLDFRVGEGFAELSGKVRKRPLPFSIPFSARFSIHSFNFSQSGKVVHLKLEEVKPFDLESLNRKLVENIPFLSYEKGLLSLDLTKVPRLAELLDYRVSSFRPLDAVILKDLSFCPGEVVGKIGVCF